MSLLIKYAMVLMVLAMLVTTSCSAEKAGPPAVPAAPEQAAAHEEVEWLTDFEAAKKMAAEKARPILADFSGSDWCGWCIKLDKEVFSKAAFQAYAEDNLVLFLADFPSRKKLPEATQKQNQALSETYGIRGFPTVLILDAEGKVLEKTGYQRGGPEAYVAHLKELIGGKK
ncbi:MAG: thioredoxin family protein [Kiritimatiellae bacterium]|nr:thioredoxin family protein [Kiritimatiellia bacterium]